MNYKVLLLCAAALLVAACSDDDGGSKVTGPLSTPSNVVYTPTTSSIHFEWGAVENATSYEATLAPEDTPSSKETINTTSTQCDFENLDEGYYLFTLMAVYADNTEYNSAVYEMRVATLGLGVAVLDAPENLECTKADSYEATLAWDAVSGAAAYSVVVTTGSTEAFNEIVTTNSCTVTGLQSGVSYTASVKALLNSDGTESEFDSPASTVSFTTMAALDTPQLSIRYLSYGVVVFQWTIQDTPSDSEPFDFELLDEDGNALRMIENKTDFAFAKYGYNLRFVFGGLTPLTNYTVGVRHRSTLSTIGSSAWGTYSFMTEAEPTDKGDYLLYWDFENVPVCANAIYLAYGSEFDGVDGANTDYSDPYNAVLRSTGSGATIYTAKFDINHTSGKYNQSYLDNYMPGLTMKDFEDGVTSNIGVSPGHMKIGSLSNAAWLTLPAVDIDGTADILLEFGSCCYIEASSGDPFTPGNADYHETFYLDILGAGTVDSSTLNGGESWNGSVATLSHYTTDELRSYSADSYTLKEHKIVIKGADSSTRIRMYQSMTEDGANHRVWFDDFKISLYNE